MTSASEYMPVSVRAWPDTGKRASGKLRTGERFIPYRLLVFDTETTTDPSQQLNFGSAKVAWIRYGDRFPDEPKIDEEIIFYADDLPQRYPDGYGVLVEYSKEHDLKLVSRAEFVQEYVVQTYHISGKKTQPRMCLTGFNLPFDISRIAVSHGRSRNGGFAFYLKDESSRTVSVKHLDSKKQIIGGLQALDLRTLVFAMTNVAASLNRACGLFQVPGDKAKSHAETHGVITPGYIDYNRQDVTATAWLALAVLRQYATHPIRLDPHRAMSPASIAKSYYEAMGIPPMSGRTGVPFDPAMLGNVMTSYFGGRAECHIRNVPVPVSVLDFTSMYPTVNALLGLWEFVTAESIAITDATSEVRAFLAGLTADDLLKPGTWPSLTGFALIRPGGDILPVRADYGGEGGTNVGDNHLHSATPMWYSLPDLVASKIRTGKTPDVIRAITLTPAGRLSTLAPVSLTGTVRIDPATEDFFTRVIEQRASFKTSCVYGRPANCTCAHCRTEAFLKVLANSGSYGIFVQMTRQDITKPGTQLVYGATDDPWEYTGTAFETAEAYCYPPVGALITSAARLMLALLESLVTAEGGTWAFCDTDSMAVVATENGGEQPCDGVTALSHAQVESIRERLNSLNPYIGKAGESLLKREHDCWTYVISAKRYALFNYLDGKPHVFKTTEHGLGLYFSPVLGIDGKPDRGWIRELWQYIADTAHGLAPQLPGWIDRPALTQSSVTSPHLLSVFKDWNTGRDYASQVRPFSFMLIASEHNPMAAIMGQERRRVVTSYSPDPGEWESAWWYDLHNRDAEAVRIGRDGMPVKTFRNVLAEFVAHPEAKYLAPDGNACNGRTTGLMTRRTVRVTGISHIGKESNKLEEVEHGEIANWHDVLTFYGSAPGTDIAREVLSMIPVRFAADLFNLITAEFVLWGYGHYVNGYKGTRGIPTAIYQWGYGTTNGRPDRSKIISYKTVHYFVNGQPVPDDLHRQFTKLAAYIVLDTTGIGQKDVLWNGRRGRTMHSPESVLAAWAANGKPNPWPWAVAVRSAVAGPASATRLCRCGCGMPLTRANQKFYTRTCYTREYRRQRAA